MGIAAPLFIDEKLIHGEKMQHARAPACRFDALPLLVSVPYTRHNR